MSYHASIGALSCPEQCESGCVEKFGAAGYPHDECVKACLAICPGGGGASKDEAQSAFLTAAVGFAVVAGLGAAIYYWGIK